MNRYPLASKPSSTRATDLLTISPELDLDPEVIRKILGMYHLPGEKVHLDANVKFAGETIEDKDARLKLFGGKTLQVSVTKVTPTGDGDAKVTYILVGEPGEHSARAFRDEGEPLHDYGILLEHEGQVRFVALKDVDGESLAKDVVLKVAPAMPRSARYAFGVVDSLLDAEGRGPEGLYANEAEFFARLGAEPISGEFSFVHKGDGDATLVFNSWMSSVSEADLAVAVAAIEANDRAPSP